MLVAQNAKKASYPLQTLSTSDKNKCLQSIHQTLSSQTARILKANETDLQLAQEQVKDGVMSSSLFARLGLQKKMDSLLQGVLDVMKLDDPVGQTTLARKLDDGLELYRVTCPVGVVLVIFEARPEVVVQISCLALKSGNAVILKGGKEAKESNQVLYELIREGIQKAGFDPEIVQLVNTRDEISALLKCGQYIDLVIPRGSNQLVRHVQENTVIPVLGHADGICSVFVDQSSDPQLAQKIVVDSKTNYPAACNSAEQLLFHRQSLDTCLLPVIQGLLQQNVKLHVSEELLRRLPKSDQIVLANEQDYHTEYLDLEICCFVVDSLQEAIEHINSHGSHHTDCIITPSKENAERFMSTVDSAGVYWNASTRFADGFRYGFGAEIGVSTNKTHARGPVGLEGMTIYKYRLYGQGHIVAEYSNGTKHFKHTPINLS
ncbi:Aldehyde/histidinol dehydrogenase [Gorgonomyces haynaldii]|nr:Aldehyde/histidinol dehydrogenase [Gorgonomyces haynaldii]